MVRIVYLNFLKGEITNMNCINEVLLIGQISSDPEIIHEDPIGVRFKLATSETYFSKKNNERVTTVEIHTIKAWKQNAEFTLKRMKRGDAILVRGKIHYHIYTTDDDRKGKAPEIIATRISKLSSINYEPKSTTEENQDSVE